MASAERYWSQLEAQSRGVLDAMDQVVKRLGAEPGDRVLLLSGSGFIGETLRAEQAKVTADAVRAGTTVNALDTDGVPHDLIERSLQTALMSGITADTGGTFFRNARDPGPGMERLASGPAVVYVMSFEPKPMVADGSFHALKVRLRAQAASIQTRAGYNAPPRETNPDSAELTQRMNAAALATTLAAGLPAKLTVTVAPGPAPAPGNIQVAIQAGARGLDWVPIAGRSTEVVTFAAVLFRRDGSYVTGGQTSLTLRVRKGTRERMEKDGITGEIHLAAAAGAYRLRVVVLESAEGRLSSLDRDVTVP